MIEDEALSKSAANAPATVARFAYGALLLLTIATIAAGWSGNKLGTLVLTSVIVIGFMVAVLGFDRLAKAKDGYYAGLALILITAVLLSIISLFITVLVYIGYGYPVWLDTFFGHKMPDAPRAEIRRVGPNSVTLSLKPYSISNAAIQIKTIDRDNFTERDQALIGAEVEEVEIKNLLPGRRYRLRVSAVIRGRNSEPLDLVAATNAERMLIRLPTTSVSAYYTGELTSELLPHASHAVVEFLEGTGSWFYEGPVENGLLQGKGTMTFRTNDRMPPCDPLLQRTCLPACPTIEFERGAVVRGECTLSLSSALLREREKLVDYEAPGVYSGQIGGLPQPGVRVGPFHVSFQGRGILNIGNNVIKGTWREGWLEGNGEMRMSNGERRIGVFQEGVLREGQVLGELLQRDRSETLSYDVAQFAPSGNSFVLRKNGFAFGRIIHGDPRGPFSSGYEALSEDGKFTIVEFDQRGQQANVYRPLTSTNADCQDRETFGLGLSNRELFLQGWKLGTINHLGDGSNVSQSKNLNDITLELAEIDVHVRGFREPTSKASVRFWIGNNFSIKQELQIDGNDVEVNDIYNSEQPTAPLTLSRFCFAQQIKNQTNGRTARATGLCKAIIMFLGRTYHCNLTADYDGSAWRTEQKIGNWNVVVNKDGADPRSLTPTSGEASLDTTTKGYDYHIFLSCVQPSTDVFGLALWGPNLVEKRVGEIADFKFRGAGVDETFRLPMPRGGVFEVSRELRKRVIGILSSTPNLNISFVSPTAALISFDFEPLGVADAFAAIASTCPG